MRINLRGVWAATKKAMPVILGIAGAAGTVGVAIVSAREGVVAHDKLKEAEEQKGSPLTNFEKVKTAAPCFKKTIIFGAVSIASSVGGVVLGKKQVAAALAPTGLVVNKWAEEKRARKENRAPEKVTPSSNNYIQPERRYRVYDPETDQWFHATWADLYAVEAELNRGFHVGCWSASADDYAPVFTYMELLNFFAEWCQNTNLQPYTQMRDGRSTEEFGWFIDDLWENYQTGWVSVNFEAKTDTEGNEYYELRTSIPADDLAEITQRD